jgi:hypothetical protein
VYAWQWQLNMHDSTVLNGGLAFDAESDHTNADS